MDCNAAVEMNQLPCGFVNTSELLLYAGADLTGLFASCSTHATSDGFEVLYGSIGNRSLAYFQFKPAINYSRVATLSWRDLTYCMVGHVVRIEHCGNPDLQFRDKRLKHQRLRRRTHL